MREKVSGLHCYVLGAKLVVVTCPIMDSFSSSGNRAGTIPDVSMLLTSSRKPEDQGEEEEKEKESLDLLLICTH